jgi:hypothetical protein
VNHVILLSVITFVLASAWSVNKTGLAKDRTISQHVGQQKVTIIVFGIAGSLATILASWAIFGWLLPHYHADILSYGVFVVLMFCFLVAALVPYIEKTRRGAVHNIAAWGMCYLIPLAIGASLFWPLETAERIFALVILATEVILLILSATRKELRRSMLAFQSTYLSLFFVFLLGVTYF